MRNFLGATFTTVLLCATSLMLETGARASTIAVGQAFFTGDPVTTFTGLATGTEVNGLMVDGITFHYLLAGTPTNGAVEIDGGPGVTNNINPPDIVSVGPNTGRLVLTLPTYTNALGYGFADLAAGTLADATTITLLDGTSIVGAMTFSGSPDPIFTGGFAGIDSTVPFNQVALTFDSANAPAFAVDNITYAVPAVPEPGSIVLLASGLAGVIARRRFVRRA